MTGNKRKGLVIQERDRRLLRELGVMRIIDREQAKLVAGFGSTTRANARLLALTQAGFLKRTFWGTIAGGRKALYALTPKSNVLVDVETRPIYLNQDSNIAANLRLEHQMQINSAFLDVKYHAIPVSGARFIRWINFPEQLLQNIPLVPDGYFEIDTLAGVRSMFLEVDLGTEKTRRWKSIARNYVQLAVSGEYSRLFSKSQFRVLALTTTEERLKRIRANVLPITDKIFWFSTFEIIKREGFWSKAWLRPAGEQKHSLL
jgi:hypothetical protein